MILNSNKNGFFGFCDDCQEYHLHFNNIFLTLSEENFKRFSYYLKNLDPSMSMIPKHEFIQEKDIILPVLHPYMLVLVNIEELNMLKKLILLSDSNKDTITHKDLPFELNDN
jgi:hypothetical protein|tara:strand:- start:240 stop:575 length:336 start_codon:yes stop_codon:yes gene_type:complete